MLDFSQRRELTLHAEVIADINVELARIGVTALVVGAFARDLHLHYGAGIQVQRATEDVDIALAMDDWSQFAIVRARLIESKNFFEVPGKHYRLIHRNHLPVDLVPFGNLENVSRQIAWPPSGEIVMDAFGLTEALATAEKVLLPKSTEARVASIASLALLKLIAWDERHTRSPKKDAADLMAIIRHFLEVGDNSARLFEQFSAWTQDDAFDLEDSAARMLGYDIRQVLGKDNLSKPIAIIRSQTDESGTGELPREMNARSPERARELLRCLLRGIES